MSNHSYLTIHTPSQGEYKEKGSKFLAFAYPVESEEEIKKAISKLKKEYFDARHHCFAWIFGADKKLFRAFDDGEPNHSAGDPILGQIRSKNLTNILIVVVRYFGGVKLGVGGLINAYKSAAEDALCKAVIVERDVTKIIKLIYDYAATPEVMRLIKEFDLAIRDQIFENQCSITVEYKLKHEENLFEKVNFLKAMGHVHDV